MIVLVAEDEKEDYKSLPFEIETHPNLRSLSHIRQFALDKYGEVFFVDDDIEAVIKLWANTDYKLSPKEIRELIDDTYYQATAIGADFFGFNNDGSCTHYNQHKPFMLQGYINGCAMGLINSKGNLYFHPNTTACESHWINLLNAAKNRFCFIDKRYHFRQAPNSTFYRRGGQSDKRTLETEKRDTILLRQFFGDSVVLKKEQNKTKRLHEYQRVLNIRL